MNRSNFIGGWLCLLVVMVTACTTSSLKTKTIENLKTAYKQESTEQSKYFAFAQKTRTEGMGRLSVLFLSVSESKRICTQNLKTEIIRLGAKPDSVPSQFIVKTTEENLRSAIKIDSNKSEFLYPKCIRIAGKEKAEQALEVFGWNMAIAQKNISLYSDALKAIAQQQTNSFYTFYLVCPICGNICYPEQTEDKCKICSTKKERFIPKG